MKKKPGLEADLDPKGTRHTRPGAKIAETAVANAGTPARKRKGAATRPGATAAGRAVQAAKGRGKRGR